MNCDYKPPSIGPEDLLIVVASEQDRPLLEPLLTNLFDWVVHTPAPEQLLKIKWVDPIDFEDYRKYHNLIVASLSNPVDSTGDILARHILGSERVTAALEGGNPVFTAANYLAKGQIFMGITAHSAVHAREELDRLKYWILEQFDQQIRVRQEAIVFKYRDEVKLTNELHEAYGFRMRFQHGYIKVKERAEKDFVWLGRGYPYRWLAVHWIDKADTLHLTRDYCWDRMDYIADELFADIFVDSMFRSSDPAFQNEHEILILRGIWGHRTQTAGGPFVTYIFRDKRQNRVYFVTGIVFHPSGSKAMLLKRLEVMMRTMHTFDEPPLKSYNGRDSLT
ncbi:MAG: DUF4837 family protein [Candidatus Marinimicrobia bacterium]|nr:DUF4837 family protein [Candidatus Neomarinimicrobiota bacterium]